MRLRIVYLWDADYPWDVRTEKMCSALTRAGHDVHIVARNKARKPLQERLPEGTVHRLRPWHVGRKLDAALSFPAFFNPRWINRLTDVVTYVKADLIIVRDLPLCPTALRVGARLKVPVVMDMAENYPAMMQEIWDAGRQKPWDIAVRNPRFVRAVESWCLPRLDASIVVVEESGDRLRRLGVASDKIAVVSNTPTRMRVSEDWQKKHERPELDIVYLGLLEIPRGVGELLKAAAILAKMNVPFRLRIVGDGRDRNLLEAEARELGLVPGNVEFLGRLEHARAIEVVGSAQVGIVPHHADEAWNTTIPNKLFDYMAAGLAVVSSDALPPARILAETGAGLVFESGHAASLADALVKLRNPEDRVRLAAAGRKAVLTKYNWETDTATLLRVVQQVVRGTTGHALRTHMRAVPTTQPTKVSR